MKALIFVSELQGKKNDFFGGIYNITKENRKWLSRSSMALIVNLNSISNLQV